MTSSFEEELSALSNKELLELEQAIRIKEDVLKNKQMALKILINSIYGATGSPYFRYYLPQIAAGTTLSGQLIIRWAEKTINEKMNKILSTTGKDYAAYIDTDSVTGDTMITVNGKTISIADYFDAAGDDYIVNDSFNQDWVKRTTGDSTPSVSKDGVLSNQEIKYVMKHKVTKKMYKITVDNKTVTVTSDHSIMVERDGEIIPVKPHHIKSSDLLITVEDEE